jgi:biotin-(acetyl-CoA carboxylase) ligase
MLLRRQYSTRLKRLATVALLSSPSYSPCACILAAAKHRHHQQHPWLVFASCALLTIASTKTTSAAFNNHHHHPTLSSSSSSSNVNNDGVIDEKNIMGTADNEARILQSLLTGSTDNSHSHISIHHIKDRVVDSTQEEARRLLREMYETQHQQQLQNDDGSATTNTPKAAVGTRFLAVIADEQARGRGTQGRTWEGGNRRGNLFITICVPMDEIPVKLTLLPLQIAVLIASQATKLLQACRGGGEAIATKDEETKVTVKWPNDVLINWEKLAGVLIESETLQSDGGRIWFLIGIGVNIAFTPSLATSPGLHLRGVTCIQDHCVDDSQQGLVALPESTSHAFGVGLTRSLVDWMHDDDKNVEQQQKEQRVLTEWKSFAQFGQTYELRSDDAKSETTGTYKGEKVIVLDIKDDGQLLVKGTDGRERLVIAEYMF